MLGLRGVPAHQAVLPECPDVPASRDGILRRLRDVVRVRLAGKPKKLATRAPMYRAARTDARPEHAHATVEPGRSARTPAACKRVALQVQRLGAVCLRDAGVADQHVS